MANRPPIGTLSFGALLTQEFPPENYIISEGMLSKNGMMFIGGPPKSYKSFVNNTLAYHLVTATNVFSAYRTNARKVTDCFLVPHPQRVLMLEQEIGFFDVRERLKPMFESLPPEQREAFSNNLFIHSRDHTMRLDTAEGTKRIAGIIESVKPDVVMFDPLIEFHASNENDSQQMNLIMHNLSLLQENYSFAMVITHHTGKPGLNERMGLDLLRGSSVLAGKLDTALLLSTTNRNAGLVNIEFVTRRGKPINNMSIKLNWQTLKAEFYEWGKISKRAISELPDDNVPMQ